MPTTSQQNFIFQLTALWEKYRHQVMHGRNDGYAEMSLRHDFLDPLWDALGWDTRNAANLPQQIREVELETRVEIGGNKKRADYIFRTDGIERFICEAKRPTEELSRKAAYQAQRYAFNLRVRIAVLTNFEDIQLFIVGGKPDAHDPFPAIKQWHFSEFVQYADELWELLSRERVGAGSLDALVASFRKKPIKGKARQGWLIALERNRTVDTEFLEYIERQRDELAKDLVEENTRFDFDEGTLNECIQRILDRLLFIRICEDRDIDTQHSLERILQDWENIHTARPPLYSRLVAHFHALDEAFNGALFRAGHISEKLHVSDEFLVNIIRDLSSEDSPYLFSTLPVEILGSVYERFIGKVVRITKARRLRVEYKPEVRKGGGVYYTPKYIVDYIVEQTVGKLIAGKSPKELAKLRFVDPACGSGSFLIRVLERIIEEHIRWYTNNPKDIRDQVCYRDGANNLHLTTHLKRQILTQNIFGVDLDRQAIEVTMLSLYLKILEGETRASIGWQQSFFPKERLLPDLTGNIKFGNSLVSTDFSLQLVLLHEDIDDVNAMDWKQEFPAIMKSGGFDAVIGNPPYGAELSTKVRDYLVAKFDASTTDTAALMMLNASRALAKKDGWIGFIVPKPFSYSSNWAAVRTALMPEIVQLVDVGKVWSEVKLEQVIYIQHKGLKANGYQSLKRFGHQMTPLCSVSKGDCKRFGFLLNAVTAPELSIAKKILAAGAFLGDFVANTRGGMFQDEVSDRFASRRVIGGKQLVRFGIRGEKGFVPKRAELPSNAFVQPESILLQNIVAHIENPVDHIKIIGTVVSRDEAEDIVILDTVNQLTNKSALSSKYFLALLLSTLMNWYVYRFIFAKAIRTMHFDGPVTDRIPMKSIKTKAEGKAHDDLANSVTRLTDVLRRLEDAKSEHSVTLLTRQASAMAQALDHTVYRLFGLTSTEIDVIESSTVPLCRSFFNEQSVLNDDSLAF
jgi:hypothetical protein